MKIKKLLILTGLAWAVTLPPALSTSCSNNSNGDYELIINVADGVTLDKPTKIFKDQDLYVHYTLIGGAKVIDSINTTIAVNGISAPFRAGSCPIRDGWTYSDEYIMLGKEFLTENFRQKNNSIEFWIHAH